MTIERLLGALREVPFCPFRLWLADGQVLDVRHPEQVSDLRVGRTVWITCATATGSRDKIVDLLLVTAIEFASAPAAA